MENTFEGKIQEKNHIFQSSKRPGNGVGIQSVRHIAEKNGGDSSFTYENGVFTEILRQPCNCQILTNRDNIMKKRQKYIDGNHLTLEELFNKIINYKKEWYEQDLVIKLIEDYKNGKRWINKYRKE